MLSLFRAGFGLVLDLKWKTERWVKDSWFHGHGLDANFWGDTMGSTLTGILKKKPKYYIGLKGEDEYQNFEWLAELDACQTLVQQLKALDMMMGRTAKAYFSDLNLNNTSQPIFHQLLFSLWARKVLDLEPGFSSLSVDEVQKFFRHLRHGEDSPPFQMPGFEDIFIRDFMEFSSDFNQDVKTNLKIALSLIWQAFSEECENVTENEINRPFYGYL